LSKIATPRTESTSLGLSIWCIVAAFGTYFCMYAFRKPFTVATYEHESIAGIGYKTILVTAQVLGYMLSKFIGIKIVAEMRPGKRAKAILVLVVIAESALLLFAIVPPPLNFICLFVNGLPLGRVFGLVVGFLEGRRSTEALTAGLCASFILADGVVKSLGAVLLSWGVSEYWMPFFAGLACLAPMLIFIWMLSRIPPPTEGDRAHRGERVPVDRAGRRAFYRRHGFGLTMLVAVFLTITVLRTIRADFAAEIWQGLGFTKEPGIFTESEIWVALGVIVVNGSCVLVGNNRAAFHAAIAISIGGLLLIGAALAGLQQGWLGGFDFMVLIGLGLYVPYVAFHTTIFERLIAMNRDRCNLGFLMNVADAAGYLGYVAVLFAKSLVRPDSSFLDFFTMASLVTCVAACLLLAICLWAFNKNSPPIRS
jgi:hypothetical protein